MRAWKNLPASERAKNLTSVSLVLDLCAVAYQIHYTVDALFNTDADGFVSATEFLTSPPLQPLFHDTVRVPLRRGDVVKVRDHATSSPAEVDAVVVGWQARSHWKARPAPVGPMAPGSGGGAGGGGSGGHGVTPTAAAYEQEEEDEEEDEEEAHLDSFTFHGTVFLVALLAPTDAPEFNPGTVFPVVPDPRHRDLLARGALWAVPEVALQWPQVHGVDAERSVLAHSDWLFDADGTCALSDHRLVLLEAR